MRLGKGNCNGTFGELVQGKIGERPFLITLPIPSLRSEAIFIPDPTGSEITGLHSNVKAKEACQKLCQKFGLQGGGHLHIRSNIPVGKGMASSSADIMAAMKAIAHSYSLPLTEPMLSSIAIEIEPTDGVMYDDVVAYDYINGELIESFGSLPPFLLVGIDVGGVVDTLQFNQLAKPYHFHDQNKFTEAYELVKEGFRKRNLSFICKAATISAHINQKLLPKPYFNEFEQLANVCRGGLVIAHSGTVFGILLDKNEPNIKEVFSYISKQISILVKKKYQNIFIR
ncbi:hypothetical protein CVD25_21985 [Bacillus canaveralius]|uniref:GHMP kinase N-terminal domain-containing protein n=1 Tax=Bacillus canaveralius TaxID=1403243 RepID=A0A2N5GHW0_9BACI|nr:hypothetical protein [Bacillus canaveralius]PLR80394.1 hypothetical protein CU635_18385 [Bacillus canaveralius]PLR88851.1 hypothetical protein CVD25_21985 [Bacillus canaveralius]